MSTVIKDSKEDAKYIADYVSGKQVRATPEEVEAVQVFAHRLVDDLGYPKDVITTRPQYRVRARPSDRSQNRGYPVDIAVFSSSRKLEDDAFILVECKRRSRADGERQLKVYLSLSSARIGVWFNGGEHVYILKKYLPDGSIDWSYLPSLPAYGQTLEDIGLLKREELKPPSNLKTVFRDIRNHLAGNTRGITRDQQLAQEIMGLLFCKIFDELDTAPKDLPRFRVALDEPTDRVAARIHDLFEAVKREYPDVFSANEEVALIRQDPESLRYVVGELQSYLVTAASRDVIGEAFEVFIGPAVRGEEGQFFTPRNVVQMLVTLIDPEPGELLVDPACGSGGFLIVALEHMWAKLEQEAKTKGWSPEQLERKRREVATRSIRGMDKDAFLTKVTKAYLAIIGDGRSGIFCDDSLERPENWNAQARTTLPLEGFDIVLTNPPFGSKIKVTGGHKLSQYRLAKKWSAPNKNREDWEEGNTFRRDQSPQLLFIERAIQFLKPGGRLGIVLPESIFGMPIYGYVTKYLLSEFRLRAFISLPEDVFQPWTHAKTCVLILEKSSPTDEDKIEMAIADWCGHDSRGNPTYRVDDKGNLDLLDDLPLIAEQLAPRLDWSS